MHMPEEVEARPHLLHPFAQDGIAIVPSAVHVQPPKRRLVRQEHVDALGDTAELRLVAPPMQSATNIGTP